MKSYLSFLLYFSLLSSCTGTMDNKVIVTGAERIDFYLPLIENLNVGIVANHTSMVGESHLVDTLLSLGVNVVKIFSPEHGFRGEADAGAILQNETDRLTGLPIVSLYGKRKKPLPEDLNHLDIILFDIQDVGARFYTYISTMQYVMESSAEAGVKFLVLDRPNPNGNYVDGPVLKTEYKSFVGMQAVPVVHGMTIGEYAMMINSEGWMDDGIKCDIQVVRCLNYTHNSEYILPVPPSPNLPNQNSVYLYPSICFFEGTHFSVGRGTDKPFQIFGHPDYPVRDFSFTPIPGQGATNPKLSEELCYGVDLSNALESELLPSDYINLDWILDAYKVFPEKDKFFNSYFNTLAGTDELKQQIIEGLSQEQIKQSWQPDLDIFKEIRSKYLLYD